MYTTTPHLFPETATLVYHKQESNRPAVTRPVRVARGGGRRGHSISAQALPLPPTAAPAAASVELGFLDTPGTTIPAAAAAAAEVAITTDWLPLDPMHIVSATHNRGGHSYLNKFAVAVRVSADGKRVLPRAPRVGDEASPSKKIRMFLKIGTVPNPHGVPGDRAWLLHEWIYRAVLHEIGADAMVPAPGAMVLGCGTAAIEQFWDVVNDTLTAGGLAALGDRPSPGYAASAWRKHYEKLGLARETRRHVLIGVLMPFYPRLVQLRSGRSYTHCFDPWLQGGLWLMLADYMTGNVDRLANCFAVDGVLKAIDTDNGNYNEEMLRSYLAGDGDNRVHAGKKGFSGLHQWMRSPKTWPKGGAPANVLLELITSPDDDQQQWICDAILAHPELPQRLSGAFSNASLQRFVDLVRSQLDEQCAIALADDTTKDARGESTAINAAVMMRYLERAKLFLVHRHRFLLDWFERRCVGPAAPATANSSRYVYNNG